MIKSCPKCGAEQSLRKRLCECGHEFYRKKKNRKRTVKDWTTLEPGDRIKVSGGPYFLSRNTGKKIMMGCKGNYTVISITDNCIVGRGVGHSQEFIYMGEKQYDDKLSIHREAHKVYLLK